ncbi:MaoC family dehydratase N-terminal domain-containing protein [Microtetraspora sp. AC03309]|uniref:FAS1-like dehydratase domain-containing protein n=1 Tax=Microtetraspora sp. AC03309 TaxID=2779376 RepID=UPI001E2B3732|nr:MaoC family dehydratase N-terminal domain-containing protein [Microtetraspora sp. AC03309]MCC5576334.1 MaoC family dehydratase N-terminal domain-containing protein [Microtetraspora sp. AC03309]
MTARTYEERLAGFVGRTLNATRFGPDPVNVPMIRHWVEAMDDANPIYLDEASARANGREGVVAPASMTQAWVMRGYAATVRPTASGTGTGTGTATATATATGEVDGARELVDLLDEGGYTSVVATDSDFEFVRELRPGDRVSLEEVVEDISAEKRTGLGTGRFVTTLKIYRDADGEVVATQRWRTLRFRPAQHDVAPATHEGEN